MWGMGIKMKRLLFTITLLFLLILPLHVGAATYNWYFDDDAADDSGAGTQGDPWKTLDKARTMIDTVGAADTATLYFDRTDTFDFVDSTGAIENFLRIDAGTVTIDAYGAGAIPIFDGGDDFENSPTATHLWTVVGRVGRDSVISLEADGATVKNIEIKYFYGYGIRINAGNNHTIQNCKVTYTGSAGIGSLGTVDLDSTGCVIENCEVGYSYGNVLTDDLNNTYGGSQVSLYSGAISISSRTGTAYGNEVRYCYVHHSYGEGIYMDSKGSTATIVEYNRLEDIKAPAIWTGNPRIGDAGTMITRYNLIWSSGSATYGRGGGTWLGDEQIGGSNANADWSFYGNIVIGANYGVWFFPHKEQIGGVVKVYNNTFIDCTRTYKVQNDEGYSDLRVENNTSIQYDLNVAHINEITATYTNWTVDNNHFYGGTIPTGAPWTTNLKQADPKLPTSSGYRSLAAAPDFVTELYPPSDSGLVDLGKTLSSYDLQFLSTGTDFDDLPSTATFRRLSQADQGSAYEIGAIIYEATGEGGGWDNSNITFMWDCEALDFSVSNGTTNYSAGDDIAVLSSGAAINAAAMQAGTNGIDCPTGADNALFTTNVANIIDGGGAGTIGFYFRIPTWTVNAELINVRQSSDGDRIYIKIVASEELKIGWEDGTDETATSTTFNGSVNTWYYAELRLDEDANTLTLDVDDSQVVSLSGTFDALTFDQIWFGDYSNAVGADCHIDQIKIADNKTEDLYAIRDEVDYAGGAGSSPALGDIVYIVDIAGTPSASASITISSTGTYQIGIKCVDGASPTEPIIIGNPGYAVFLFTFTYGTDNGAFRQKLQIGSDWYIVVDMTLVAGDRITDLVLTSITLGGCEIENTTEVAFDTTTMPTTGGAITLAVPKPNAAPWLFPGDFDTHADGVTASWYEVINDFLRVSSGDVTVQTDGTNGNPITFEITNPMSTFDLGDKDYITIRGSNRIGTISNNGGTGCELIVIPYEVSPAMMPGMGM